MAQFSCLKYISFGDELEPIGNKVVYRALPFAVRVATFETAVRLFGNLRCSKRLIDFNKSMFARSNVLFRGILPRFVKELKSIV